MRMLLALAALAAAMSANAEELILDATRPTKPIDRVEHQLEGGRRQVERLYSYTFAGGSDPRFAGAKTLNVAFHDEIGNNGTHRGYASWMLTDGGVLYVHFDGRHAQAATDADITFDGTLKIVGGAKGYEKASGGGTYTGKAGKDASRMTMKLDADLPRRKR